MRRALLLLLAALGLATLAGCDVNLAGINVTTTIEADGSGQFLIEVGFLPSEDGEQDEEISCSGDSSELPPGAQMRQEMRGQETWCIVTMPFADISELRTAYQELFQEALVIHCLDYSGAELIYDLELLSSEPIDPPVTWRVEAPGLISEHNGTSSGGAVSWDLYGSARMTINVPDSGLCPTEMMALSVLVEEDGTGSGTLLVPRIGDSDANQAVADQLAALGWQVSSAAEGDQMQAGWTWSDAASFHSMFASILGVDGTTRGMELTLEEDTATGQTEYKFEGTLYFTEYVATWQGLRPDHEPPPFRLDYLPPGLTETTVGRWTNADLLEYIWTPDSPTGPISLQAISVVQPETELQVDEAALEANIEYVLERFNNAIPQGQIVQDPSAIQQVLSGIFGTGIANNMTNWTTYACGDYQTRVLSVLDSIRTASSDDVRARLAGLDYGPIQAYNGGHQAVVLFPRGTDWRSTGIVLDPWPNQRPETYPIADWMERFSWGHGPGEGASDYPHLFGNPPHYAGTRIPPARRHPRRIGVNSPVAVMIVASDGRRLGMDADGEFVNEIEGADFYPVPKGGGEYQWYAGLPEGDYEITFTGTAEGNTHILVGDENGQLVTYGPQPTAAGQVFSIELGGPIESMPLDTGSAEIAPTIVTERNVKELDFGRPAASGRPEWLTSRNIGLAIAGAGLFLICLVGVAALAAGGVLFFRRRSRP